MYKYADKRVREIADSKTISSFEESSKIPVDWSLVDHMIVDEDYLDLDKARNAQEAAFFYKVTKDPTKQGLGQKTQLQTLKKFFGKEIELLKSGSVTMENGIYISSESIVGGVVDDLDFIHKAEKILFSAKHVDNEGGSQNDQFDEMKRLIERAGLLTDNNSWALGIYLSGSLWDKTHSKYRNFETQYVFPTSLKGLLTQMASGKKVAVFSDSDLPNNKTSFKKHFGL